MSIYYKEGEGVINQLSIDSDSILLDPYTQNPIYQFEYKYLLNQDLSKVSTGICVGLNANTNFEFDIVNRLDTEILDGNIQDDYFFNGIKVDILNKNAGQVFNDFAVGLINTFEFTKEDNIAKFGGFQKDFGIRVDVDDKTRPLYPHVSEFYVYRNPLYIKNVTVTDKNGTYLNQQPIGYQAYTPIIKESQYLTPTIIGDNTYYIPKYTLTINNKNVKLDFKIVFATQKQESIKITWGDGTETIPFYYNNGIFVGPGVTVTSTSASDEIFVNNNITEINGKTYEFTVSKDYTSNSPINYVLNIDYDDNSITEYENLTSYQAVIPNGLSADGNGVLMSQQSVNGKLDFKVDFLNSESFASFDKVSIYGKQSSDVSISESNFIKDATLFSPDEDGNYNFYIGQQEIELSKNYWFYLVPYSQIGSGFAWKIGPYQIDQEIAETRADLEGKGLSILGTGASSLSEIKECQLTDFNEGLVDQIKIGAEILCCEYFATAISNNKDVCSSKIIVTNNFENTDPLRKQYYMTEYAISDNSFIDYYIEESVNSLTLKAKINTNINAVSPSASLVVHKTSLQKIQIEE